MPPHQDALMLDRAARSHYLVRLFLERLHDRTTPAVAVAGPALALPDFALVLGPDDGGPPVLRVIDRQTGVTTDLTAFDTGFRGGVRSAVGDVTGDGVLDLVVAAGPGGGPHVKVLDGETGGLVREFFAYSPTFTGGVEVAVGDVNRDGFADVVTAAGAGGGPHVKVFDGRTGAEVRSFFAFDAGFRGGAFVAVADVNRDGFAEVVVGAGAGGGPHVKTFDGKSAAETDSFYAFEPQFAGGVRVAAGDLTGDGFAELVLAAGRGGGPRVKTLDGRTGAVVSDRFVEDVGFTGGVRVAVVPGLTGGSEVISHTRTGDLVRSVAFPLANGVDLPHDAWVGDGSPPAGVTVRQTVLPPPPADSFNPIRTLQGAVGAVAADGKSLTLFRGNGSAVTLNLAGDEPAPFGTVSIGGLLPAAEVYVGDLRGTASDLHAGDWVRVRVARAFDSGADAFTALSVQAI